MRKYQNGSIYLLAVMAGIFLSISYVNPYEGKIFLSELVLQLSGSRGEFVLNYKNALELVEVAMRLLPCVIMEVFLGIALYWHFCTASVYVFSRCTDRGKWYWREILSVGRDVFIFQGLMVTMVIIAAAFRCQVQVDMSGIYLLVCHLALYSLWSYSIVVLINLIALKFGSSLSFTVVMAIQSIGIVLLGAGKMAMRINPIARLVLGWQKSFVPKVDSIQESAFENFYLEESLLFLAVINIVILITGAIIVKRHDLLISDSEIGVG